ncbi:hypothetical protein [Streptomyces sp. NPDC005336]|uniref:hypothetical protein n=1 Tax=Streptomyces sp. NPDC005336 TaxID=3157035 RepID=UPI0033A5AA14
MCPHLRNRYVALRASSYRLHGVHGITYMPGPQGPKIYNAETVAFGDWRIRWVEACQLVMRLGEYTVIDLAAQVSDAALKVVS